MTTISGDIADFLRLEERSDSHRFLGVRKGVDSLSELEGATLRKFRELDHAGLDRESTEYWTIDRAIRQSYGSIRSEVMHREEAERGISFPEAITLGALAVLAAGAIYLAGMGIQGSHAPPKTQILMVDKYREEAPSLVPCSNYMSMDQTSLTKVARLSGVPLGTIIAINGSRLANSYGQVDPTVKLKKHEWLLLPPGIAQDGIPDGTTNQQECYKAGYGDTIASASTALHFPSAAYLSQQNGMIPPDSPLRPGTYLSIARFGEVQVQVR